MKVSQKQAVRNAIFSVLEEKGQDYELNSSTTIGEVFNADDKAKAREILFAGFKSGEIEYKASFQSKVNDDAELKKYVSGLLNNWMRKDKELNAGTIYKAKNPGSRAGSQDEKVKEMRKLLKVTADEKAKALIQQAISDRIAEIKPTKSITIDPSVLPESLRHLVPTHNTESVEETAE